MKESGVPFLFVHFSVDRIADLMIIVIKHRQTILCLECIHQILRRLMKVPSASPYSPTPIQHIRPVGTSETCVIILIVGTLYGKDRFLAVLVIRQKDVAEIFQIIILGIFNVFRICYHLAHIFFIYMRYAGSRFITVSPCQVQITLCQVSRSGNLIYPSAISLFVRQHIIGSFKISYYFTKEFLIRKLVISYLLDGIV